MRTISKLWKKLYSGLGQVDPKHPLGDAVIKKTMNPQKYVRRAKMIVGMLNARDSILEIGCGYGGLAKEVLKRISVSYTVVDNEIMLIQTKKFLGNSVEYVEAGEIETLQDRKFTLFASFHCLSETPPEYRKYVLENIIKNCQRVSIMDLHDASEPSPRMLRRGYEIFPLEIEKWLEKYFVIVKNLCRHKQVMYTGERKK